MSQKTCIGLLLFVSLAVNFFFIGGMLMHRPPMPPSPFERVEAVIDHMPPAARDAARVVLEQYRPQFEMASQDMRAARAEVQATLGSEHYTRAQGARKFDAMEKQMDTFQLLMKNMLLDISEKLPPEERVKLVPQRPGHEGDKPRPAEPHGPPPAGR